MPLKTLNLNGVNIVCVDYSTCIAPEDMIEKIISAAKLVDTFPGKVSVIADYTNTFVSNEFLEVSKKLVQEVFSKKVDKACYIGISEVKRILLNAAKDRFPGKIIICETKEEALEKLAPATISQAS